MSTPARRIDRALSGAASPDPTRADIALFDTAIGICAISWRADAVVGFRLPEADPDAARERLRRAGATQSEPTENIRAAIEGVRAHLTGELDDLRWIRLDLTGLPGFHRTVYEITRAIDPGHTLSYGQVAERAGLPGAAQAVGQALGRNPIALIVPCHRVLAADHALHGFSAPGGIGTKARLLEIERTPGFGEPTLF
ncbi:methylated-DNA--[protein]-cysteine S-methyltransferase [Nocardia higoensis]|uniref:Methylated-DNA--[protein]-cysteine S-methyltransferase n=1 Tax=Nocardia higoensis TaxID=228599 RepID=A0ABS0DD58_9NOCA|nr:methylated-DNA--[protein]-cysteine S-methyltransferase [Nocardia higoensis]MBF6356406.1 methylated-DNA--[protein]-cysteine S-methyltransferase [Nocardia higoensis]